MAAHSSILDWRSPHGQRSLAGYCSRGRKGSDTTEATKDTAQPPRVGGDAQTGPLGPPPPTAARRWEELLHLLSQWLADGWGKRGPQRRGSVCLPAGGRLACSLPALVHLKGVGKE